MSLATSTDYTAIIDALQSVSQPPLTESPDAIAVALEELRVNLYHYGGAGELDGNVDVMSAVIAGWPWDRRPAPGQVAKAARFLDDELAHASVAHQALLDPPIESDGNGTDLDASREFIAAYQNEIRYCEGIGWLHFTGKYWKAGAEAEIRERAQRCAKSRTRKAHASKDHDEVRKQAIYRALTMESSGRISGAIMEAQVDHRIRIDVAQLDAHPYLFNCLNGTLDLRTGVLRPHSRAELLTKLAPVEYHADAKHKMFSAYLESLEATNPGLTSFLARLVGMSLTADASAESLVLLQGEGAAGKTTLSDGVAAMLGDYAVKLPFTSFMLSRHGRSPGAASPDLIRLRGSRFAFAAEGDQTARLDAGVIKNLTGNEKVSARGLYKEPIEFPGTWKLWLVSNYDPRCDSEDSGLWRRIIKVVFPVVPVEKRDPAIKRAMTEDPACWSAMLAWAVAGCMDWLKRGGGKKGLEAPATVEKWTTTYREAMDPLSQWATDARVVFGGNHCTPVKALRSSYEEWSQDNGFPPVLGRRFNEWLRARGAEKASNRIGAEVVNSWRGVTYENH